MKHRFFNKALRILLVTNALVLIAGAMLGPIYALFVEDIGGSLLDASITQAVFALVAGITTLLAGRYADKVKYESKIVVWGYLLMGLGFFLYSFVNSLWFLLIIQALIGFAEALYAPAFDSLYSKHLTKKKVGTEWGAWEAMDYFSTTVGAIIGGVIATYFGFTTLFTAMSLLCLISALYIHFLPKRVL